MRKLFYIFIYVLVCCPSLLAQSNPHSADTSHLRNSTFTHLTSPPQQNNHSGNPLYFAVKSNLLYDAALIPNLGAEFYLGHNLSVAADGMFAWWSKHEKDFCYRICGAELEMRWWFGRAAQQKALQGHHIGLYGQFLTYDIMLGNRGYQCDDGSYGVGVAYGYSLPIAKRLNLDFTIGLGLMSGQYKEYLPIEEHYVWQITRKINWWGPTKAEVSLVWLLGRDNLNKKGGRR